jgi:hypothetical protein
LGGWLGAESGHAAMIQKQGPDKPFFVRGAVSVKPGQGTPCGRMRVRSFRFPSARALCLLALIEAVPLHVEERTNASRKDA